MNKINILIILLLSVSFLQAQCTFQMSGTVTSDSGNPVSGMTVMMTGDLPEFPITTLTDGNGNYSFSFDTSSDFSFELTVEDDTNWNDGVSTLDLVLIHRHVLGIQSLGNEGYILAADADDNGTITVSDLINFRLLILGWITELPASNIIDIPQYEIDNGVELQSTDCVITNSSGPFDFKVYKRGDVNGTWSKN